LDFVLDAFEMPKLKTRREEKEISRRIIILSLTGPGLPTFQILTIEKFIVVRKP
jgi:hypothetical protein